MEKGMIWKVGDRAIIDCTECRNHGLKVTVLSELKPNNPAPGSRLPLGVPVHVVDAPVIHAGANHFVVQPHELKPIPDTYDGNEVTSWDECPWQPSVLA